MHVHVFNTSINPNWPVRSRVLLHCWLGDRKGILTVKISYSNPQWKTFEGLI